MRALILNEMETMMFKFSSYRRSSFGGPQMKHLWTRPGKRGGGGGRGHNKTWRIDIMSKYVSLEVCIRK